MFLSYFEKLANLYHRANSQDVIAHVREKKMSETNFEKRIQVRNGHSLHVKKVFQTDELTNAEGEKPINYIPVGSV